VDGQPGGPAEQSGELQAPDAGQGWVAADHRHRALIAVAKRLAQPQRSARIASATYRPSCIAGAERLGERRLSLEQLHEPDRARQTGGLPPTITTPTSMRSPSGSVGSDTNSPTGWTGGG
jgi:hypothetical protein